MLTILGVFFGILLIAATVLACTPRYTEWTYDIGSFRVGLQHDLVHNTDGTKYLERWFIYIGITLRFHLFHSGDDLRAPHDHPWPFITFPFRGYDEKVFTFANGGSQTHVINRTVKPFRFHYRPASFKHIVLPRADGKKMKTFVITGWKSQSWGFYPFDVFKNRRVYVPWRVWK